MKKYSAILAVFIALSATAFSQLKGKITDAVTHNPLNGATITIAGKNIATSNSNGTFEVICSNPTHITVSYIGYETWQQTIKNCDQELEISLTPLGSYLSNVEISATSTLNKSLIYQPSSIAKLSTVELKRSTGLYFDDVINVNVPGVTFERRAVNSGQQFNIRGYGNGSRGTRGVSSNFDGQGYKVYLNGIPVTDAEGITVMDDIDFGSIGNVEVVKGPAGTLYGLAIAGAVNLKSVKPQKGKTFIGQEVMLGSYGLQRYTTSLQTAGERSSLLLNYGKQKSDGYFIHNASHKDFVNLVSEFNPREKQTITAYVGYSNSYDERGGEQTIAQYQAKSDTGNLEYIKRNAHSRLISYRAGVGHTYAFTKWLSNTTSLFGTGLIGDASSAGGWTDKVSLNYGTRSVFDTKFVLSSKVSLTGITGFELQQQRASTIGYNLKADPFDATPTTWAIGDPYWVLNAITSDFATVAGTSSFFTEWTATLPYDVSLTAGIGFSRMKIELNDRFTGDTITKTFSGRFDTSYKKMVSPHFAINKVFSKAVSLYASYSEGFKAPVSSYFYIATPKSGSGATYIPATGRVNSTLKPEHGIQFEFGSKGSLLKDKLYYELAYFNAKFKDKMTAVAVANENNTATSYSYIVNAGSQEHNGFEALVKYTVYQSTDKFVRSVRPFANFTYSDFKYKNYSIQSLVKKASPNQTKDSVVIADYSGHAVAGVPKFTANFGLDFSFKYGIYGNITYLYRDKMEITSNGLVPVTTGSVTTMVPYQVPSYSLLNAKIGVMQSLGNHFDLDVYAGVNNITNTLYPIKVFVNQIPDAFIPGPRNANYYGGVNLKYNF
ncbi:MAG: TonB-dependent receptor [Ferruginibacter sp.]